MNIENQRMMGHDHMHAGHLPSSGEEELDEVMENMTNGLDSHHLQPPSVAINGCLRRPPRHPLTKSLSGTVCYTKGVPDLVILVSSLEVLVYCFFLCTIV